MSYSDAQPILPDGNEAGGGGQHHRARLAAVAVAVAAALAGAAIAHFAWSGGSPAQSASIPGTPAPSSASGSSSTTASAASVSDLAAKVDDGLVDINTTLGSEGAAAGTGMVVSSSGEVITNNHVIEGATSITATDVGTGRTYKARVVGYDRTKDIAVIQLIGATGLKTVSLGNSSSVRVGQTVVTIGNAGGAGGTPSAASGTVTALSQSITASDEAAGSTEQLKGLIELDGSLEPGDSGGPLVDSSGTVIAMDTAASSGFSFDSSSGDGFAIPINEVLTIAGKIERGTSTSTIHIGATALIGVEIASTEYGSGYGYGSGSTTRGALVEGVESGSPAAAAGLAAGDTITALGGQSVSSATALTEIRDRYHPGDHVRISWVDASGASHTATITLASGAAD